MKSAVFAVLGACVLSSRLLAFDFEAAVPQIDHVLVVEFENTDYSKAIVEPNFAQIVKEGANLSNFYAETHPSQPNYIAMVAGDTYGVTGDGNVNLNARHLGDLLEEAGKTWKVYADGYPGNCYLKATSGKYARKHVPFLSFKNVQSNPDRCASIVKGSDLTADIEFGNLPTFSLYIPDLDDDAHDTDVAYAGKWVKNTFKPWLVGKLPPRTLVIFTFDESSLFSNNHIYTSFWGDVVKPGSIYAPKIDHYGLLHTIETLLGVGDLGKKDSKAPIVDGIWQGL